MPSAPPEASPESSPDSAPDAQAAPRGGLLVQRLQGGLGNQLFQIAATLTLAERWGLEPAFDYSRYAHDGYGRRPLLDRLWPGARVQALAQLPAEATRMLDEAGWSWPLAQPAPPVLALPQGVRHLVLEGYWQDHRFATPALRAGFRRHLAAALAAPDAPPLSAAHLACQAMASEATALHVRRHDYKHHGLCSERYAVEALRWLADRHPGAPVLVFSDEPNYTGHFLRAAGLPHQIVRGGHELADLQLMSRCARHVIANSTFSWWGAALAESRCVIAPEPWSLLQASTESLYPPHWWRLPGAVVDDGPGVGDFRPLLEVRAAITQLSVPPAGAAGGVPSASVAAAMAEVATATAPASRPAPAER